MQYPEDEDLAEGILTSLRSIYGLLELDWGMNGQYDHAYSQITGATVSVSGDKTITGDMPEDTNTITGYASGEITVVVAGKNSSDDEMTMSSLFSPWKTDSPIYGIKVIGTPARYSRVIQTPEGKHVVRQFTGWVREFEISRDSDEVTLTLSDVADLQTSEVSLPLWAIIPQTAARRHVGISVLSSSRPMSLTWPVEEVLRQAGRPTGPVPHPNAVWYQSCNGSMLPSYDLGDISESSTCNFLHYHGISWFNRDNDPFIEGKFGLAPNYINITEDQLWGGSGVIWGNYGVGRSNRALYTPTAANGLSHTIGMGMWVHSTGSATADYEEKSYAKLSIGMQWNRSTWFNGINGTFFDRGPTLEVYSNGTARLNVMNSAWSQRRTVPTTEGWHYYDARFVISASDVTMTLTIDGEPVTLTVITDASGGYVVSSNQDTITASTESYYRNQCLGSATIPAQHMQIYHAPTGQMPAFNFEDAFPRVTNDGRPLAVLHGSSLAELDYLPDVFKVSGQDVLKELCQADFAIMHTDEYGTLHYVPHYVMRSGWEDQLEDAQVIDDERLLGFLVNPTLDGKRNSIVVKYNDNSAVWAQVWNNGNPDFWHAKKAQTGFNGDTIKKPVVENIISILSVRTTKFHARSQEQPYYRFENYSTAVMGEDWSIPAGIDPYFIEPAPAALGDPPQRMLRIHIRVYSNVTDPYDSLRFSFADDVEQGTQVQDKSANGGIFLTGIKYGEPESGEVTVDNAADIAVSGKRTAILEGNDWRQTPATARAIAESVLNDTLEPAPIIKGISVPADARIQLLDVVRLTSEAGITGAIIGQVIGRSMEDGSGFTDLLDIRILQTPGEWRLGDPNRSQLGQTTILG